ncbi:hypothetical protein [Burkholderia sp. SCN-KJ]|uniref:hypothetical protein n=1 Tax=Burkholderia sp. SCN-KJ TaxID=2969248 RepID=UPI0035B0DA90
MGLLYRGGCEEDDGINGGRLRPKGKRSEVSLTRDDATILQSQRREGIMRDATIMRYPSETNAVRSQHIQSGLDDNYLVSFTRSIDKACAYATRTADGDRTNGS